MKMNWFGLVLVLGMSTVVKAENPKALNFLVYGDRHAPSGVRTIQVVGSCEGAKPGSLATEGLEKSDSASIDKRGVVSFNLNLYTAFDHIAWVPMDPGADLVCSIVETFADGSISRMPRLVIPNAVLKQASKRGAFGLGTQLPYSTEIDIYGAN